MLAELRQKSQITIPKEIIVKPSLSEGDKLLPSALSLEEFPAAYCVRKSFRRFPDFR